MNHKSFIVSSAELCEIMCISQRHLGRLEREGMPKVKRGTWHLPSCLQFFIARKKRRTQDRGLIKQRIALYKAQTEKAEIENAKSQAELVPVEECTNLGLGILTIYEAVIPDIAPRAAARIQPNHTEAEIQRIIDEEVYAARTAAADAFDDWPTKGGAEDESETTATKSRHSHE